MQKPSKKLTTAILGCLFLILSEYLGINISDQVKDGIQYIVMAYLGGQSLVDVAKIYINKKK